MGHYSNAVRWVRSAAPRLEGRKWAARALDASLIGGILVLGTIGLISPSSFGDRGAVPVQMGWPWFALLAGLLICIAAFAPRWRRLRDLVRIASRAVGHEDVIAGAADSLAAARPSFQTRFALGWVWGPTALLVVGMTFAFATAYFAVDALLARFQVGWESAALAIANTVVAYALFRLAAFRASRLPISHRAHRDAASR